MKQIQIAMCFFTSAKEIFFSIFHQQRSDALIKSR